MSNHHIDCRLWFTLILPVILAILLPGCNRSSSHKPTPAEPEVKETQAISGPHFRFSEQQPVTGGTDGRNWCRGSFDKPVVMNAEKENPNRRYFYLGPGATKVAIGPTGMTALFILRPAGNGIVEIFNGANFPACLSLPANFSPAGPAAVVHYRNHKNMTFALETREDSGHALVTIELPEGHRYSMDVRHCTNCE